jgi:hypothetical protein
MWREKTRLKLGNNGAIIYFNCGKVSNSVIERRRSAINLNKIDQRAEMQMQLRSPESRNRGNYTLRRKPNYEVVPAFHRKTCFITLTDV